MYRHYVCVVCDCDCECIYACMNVCVYVCSLGMHIHLAPGRPGDYIFTMAPNIWNVICSCSPLHTKYVSIHVHQTEDARQLQICGSSAWFLLHFSLEFGGGF